MDATREFTIDDRTYEVALTGRVFEVYADDDGYQYRAAHGTWDGNAIDGDCTADLGDELWAAIEEALIDMQPEGVA